MARCLLLSLRRKSLAFSHHHGAGKIRRTLLMPCVLLKLHDFLVSTRDNAHHNRGHKNFTMLAECFPGLQGRLVADVHPVRVHIHTVANDGAIMCKFLQHVRCCISWKSKYSHPALLGDIATCVPTGRETAGGGKGYINRP